MADPRRLESSRRRRLPIATARPRRCSSTARSLLRRPVRRRHSPLDARPVSRSHRTRAPAPTSIARGRRSPSASASPTRCSQASHDLLEQGQTEAARHLLTEAVATTGDDEHAAALRVKLERLERLERAHLRRRASDRPNAGVPATPRPAWRSRGRSAGALLVGDGRDRGGPRGSGHAPVGLAIGWVCGSSTEQLTVSTVTSKRPPVLSSADVALVRARNAVRPRPARRGAAGARPGGPAIVRRGRRPTRCASKSSSCCSQVDRSASAPRRTDDEMSEVPLLELRARAALQELRLRRSRCPSLTSRSARRRIGEPEGPLADFPTA